MAPTPHEIHNEASRVPQQGNGRTQCHGSGTHIRKDERPGAAMSYNEREYLMRPKFLLGLLPLIAATAFAVGPVAAAQARRPCFENTSATSPCITTTETLVGTSKSLVFTDTQSGSPLKGVQVTCEAKFEGPVKNVSEQGQGEIPNGKAKFTPCTINVPGCTVKTEQLSKWTVLTSGTAGMPATYDLSITIPEGEAELVISGCAEAGTFPFAGTVDGNWTNDNPSTVTFENAPGLILNGTDSTTLTGVVNVTRGNGSNIFLS